MTVFIADVPGCSRKITPQDVSQHRRTIGRCAAVFCVVPRHTLTSSRFRGNDRCMNEYSAIVKPALIVDEQRARENIRRIAERAASSGVRYRPHFKTHQSTQVGRWFRDYGVNCITVSSLSMAAYFADDGWDDITVAFPVNVRESRLIGELAGRVRLNLLVLDGYAVETLERILSGQGPKPGTKQGQSPETGRGAES